MQTSVFTYPFFYRMIYRYAIIPANLLLLFYVLPFMFHFAIMKYFYGVVLAILLYMLNSYFWYLRNIIPYRIEVDGNKIRCSKFLFSRKIVEFEFADIENLLGGIFEKKTSGMYRIRIKDPEREIGFFNLIGKSRELQNLLLQGVNRKVYEMIISRITAD